MDTTDTLDTDTESGFVPDDLEAARAQKLEQMGAPQSTITGEDRVREDYFGLTETHKVLLPDGVSYVLHQELAEGQRKSYLNAVNRDVTLNRKTQDVKLRTAPGDDRHALLKVAIVGWDLERNGQAVPFNFKNLDDFLKAAPPRVVDIIEKDIRKHNAWINAEFTAQDIRDEIAQLQELLEEKEKEEAGNSDSSS